jgi:hypothetical protein
MSSLAPPYIDLGVPVDVWATERPSNSIADIAFTPISEDGIELTNDYEPVLYQANRALMTANASQEIADLQTRNHATTAYSTLDCHATPLFPTFNGQRAVDCTIREARKFPPRTLYPSEMVAQPVPPLGYPPEQVMGTPGYYAAAVETPVVVPGYGRGGGCGGVRPSVGTLPPLQKKTDVDEDEPAPGAAAPGAAAPPTRGKSFARNMVNSVRGTAYDLAHWSELPPASAGESSSKVLAYAVTRDSRTGYLMLWYALFTLLVALIGAAVKLGCKQ